MRALCRRQAAVRGDEGRGRSRRSELRLALIKAHPDLANKTQRAAGLTAESNAEQNSVGLDRLSDAEYEAFERVNNAYRAKFGFPYIVCVRRHTKDSILRDFERRLPNDATTEIADLDRGNLPDRGAARRSAGGVGRSAAGARAAVDPCARYPQRQAGGGDRGRTGRAVRARRKPRRDARDHQQRRPHRSAVDRRPAGADRPLRTDASASGIILPRGRCRCRIRRFSIPSRCAFR